EPGLPTQGLRVGFPCGVDASVAQVSGFSPGRLQRFRVVDEGGEMGRLIVGLGILATLVVGGGSSGGREAATSAAELAPGQGKYAPSVDPADFVARVDNPLWPLKPGTAFHYVGTRGNTPQKDDELVTQRTKRIVGIRCTVVRDTVSEHGLPIE